MTTTSPACRPRRWTNRLALGLVTSVGALTAVLLRPSAAAPRSVGLTFSNPSGVHRTIVTTGEIDPDNPFFQDLGTNGRTCFSCHRPAQAWTVTPEELTERFAASDGLDPIFRNNDGSNCEGADVSDLAMRRQAFSLLLSKGLLRIELNVPASL